MSSTTEARVAVITGGSSGIGLHAARALRSRGLNVYELSRRAENAEPGVTHLQADVTDEAQVNAAVAESLKQYADILEKAEDFESALHDLIQKTIKALKKEHELNIPKDLAYVEGKLFEDYIHDMKLTQQFAMLNRKAMVDVIMTGMGFTAVETFTTIHNYIDTDAMILRKGSVSAKAGEKLLIPINMRDGSLICSGKGNEDWNCSAPHGAGRLMSRKAAFNALSMEEFQKEMEGIYTTCVVPDTLDESPMAYKSMEEIVAQIGPTAEIIERIRPVYNFKAAD